MPRREPIPQSLSRPTAAARLLAACILVTALALHFPPAAARAGQAQAALKCSSPNRRGGAVKIEGQIPGDLDMFRLKINVGRSEMTVRGGTSQEVNPLTGDPLEAPAPEPDLIDVVKSFKHRVFTMTINRDRAAGLRLYAIPATLRWSGGANDEKATFDAILEQSWSPVEGETLRNVRLRCSYHYSI